MRLAEVIKNFSSHKQGLLDDIRSVLYGQGGRFIRDVYGERSLTPLQLQRQCRLLYETNAYVAAAVNTLKDFIMGDEVSVEGGNASKKFFRGWFEDKGFLSALETAVESMLVTGNGYMIVSRDSVGRVNGFKGVPDSSRVYHVVEGNGEVTGFVLKRFRGGRNHRVWNGSTDETVKGDYYPLKSMVYLKWGEFYGYGRSILASAVNDGMIMREIERAIAVISRYKAVPKKLMIAKGVPSPRLQEIARLISSAEDMQNPLVNVDMDLKDLSYSGNVDLNAYIDYFKRKITAGLAPDYLIHGEETNRATSREQRLAFMFRVKSMRRLVKKNVDWVIKEVAGYHGLDAVGLDFGEINLNDEMQERQLVLTAFNSGVMSANEARSLMGLPEVEEDFFKWEVQDEKPQEDLVGGSGEY